MWAVPRGPSFSPNMLPAAESQALALMMDFAAYERLFSMLGEMQKIMMERRLTHANDSWLLCRLVVAKAARLVRLEPGMSFAAWCAIHEAVVEAVRYLAERGCDAIWDIPTAKGIVAATEAACVMLAGNEAMYGDGTDMDGGGREWARRIEEICDVSMSASEVNRECSGKTTYITEVTLAKAGYLEVVEALIEDHLTPSSKSKTMRKLSDNGLSMYRVLDSLSIPDARAREKQISKSLHALLAETDNFLTKDLDIGQLNKPFIAEVATNQASERMDQLMISTNPEVSDDDSDVVIMEPPKPMPEPKPPGKEPSVDGRDDDDVYDIPMAIGNDDDDAIPSDDDAPPPVVLPAKPQRQNVGVKIKKPTAAKRKLGGDGRSGKQQHRSGNNDDSDDIDEDEFLDVGGTADGYQGRQLIDGRGGKAVRKRKPWTKAEVDALEHGVTQYGTEKWAMIHKHSNVLQEHRKPQDLRDKWRNIQKDQKKTDKKKKAQGKAPKQQQRRSNDDASSSSDDSTNKVKAARKAWLGIAAKNWLDTNLTWNEGVKIHMDTIRAAFTKAHGSDMDSTLAKKLRNPKSTESKIFRKVAEGVVGADDVSDSITIDGLNRVGVTNWDLKTTADDDDADDVHLAPDGTNDAPMHTNDADV